VRKTTSAAFVLFVACAGLGASGCSFAFVHRYHEPAHPGDPVHCTSSHKLALIDGAVAVAMYAASIFLSRYPDPDYPLYSGSVAGGVGVGFGVSALYGVWNVHKCREGLEAAKTATEAAPTAPAAPAATEVPAEAAPPAAAEEPPAPPPEADEAAPAADQPAPEPKARPAHKKHKKKPKRK
jgi:hypothetical protein